MKVSIVTISFNQRAYLERAILSILNQDYPDIEYIVVDPGSTDGSRDLIQHYSHAISRIIFEPDNGPADGLNKGFALASGEIFGFLNSDDVLLPGAVSKIANYFSLHPETDIVSGHAIVIDENDNHLRRTFSDRGSLVRVAYGAAITIQPSTFFRSEVFRSVGGFNTDNRTNWDGELFVDMRMRGAKSVVVPQFLSGYRLQPDSITSSKKLDAGIRAYHQRIFKKIMRREWRRADRLRAFLYRLLKYLYSPQALYERVIRGPIYGRRAQNRARSRKSAPS